MTVSSSQKLIQGLGELRSFWRDFLPTLGPRTILLLEGGVGAGKTTSVQMMAEALGMQDVQSPSFAIHLRYENSQGLGMDHLDLYRLDDEDDLESSGFWDLFAQTQGLIVIEWAQRLNQDYLPLNWNRIQVQIEKTDVEGQRRVTVTPL